MQTLDINTDNTLAMRVVVSPEHPPEYKQHYYQEQKRQFAIKLYEALEQLTTPTVVELRERPIREVYPNGDRWMYPTNRYSVVEGWEFRAHLYRVQHQHIVVNHFDGIIVPKITWRNRIFHFFKRMVK